MHLDMAQSPKLSRRGGSFSGYYDAQGTNQALHPSTDCRASRCRSTTNTQVKHNSILHRSPRANEGKEELSQMVKEENCR